MVGGRKVQVTEETCINKLPFSVIKTLSLRLDIDRLWEKLVMKIPKRLQDVGSTNPDLEMRYSNFQIRLFEDKAKRPDGSPTNTILNDWATQNTKVKHLLQVLQDARLYEAADYISESVLHQGKVSRSSAHCDAHQKALPQPEWGRQKLPNGNASVQDSKISSTNLDGDTEKLYHREKEVACSSGDSVKKKNISYSSSDNESQSSSLYDGLVRNGKDNEYNSLSPTGGDDVMCARYPAYTSGGNRSMLLEGGNMASYQTPGQNRAVEHEEVIYSKAKAVPQDPIYSYASLGDKGLVSPKRREPCEMEEEQQQIPSKTDIYKLIGIQKNMNYDMLKRITNDFDRRPLLAGGRLIGAGGFGDVFLGQFENGSKIAIKRLKDVDEIDKQFQTEMESLTKNKHKNIVCLYGYSIDGPGKCLVYEYLPNGSLEDRLVQKDETPALSVNQRLSILYGTAEGIAYLNEKGIVHRDIKSANVLLDMDFSPKVGDFATARGGPRGNATMPMSTSVVIGTSAYLAPEAMNFDVSTKLDAYSFGVIILEVLTALPPLDPNREDKDLKSHLEEHDVRKFLDTSGGKWAEDIVDTLYELSEKCTKKKKQRCNVVDILPDLKALCDLKC